MKKLLVVCGFLAAAAVAQAGMQSENPVVLGTGQFFGSLGDARKLPGSQYIECTTGSSASSRYGSCSAYMNGTSAYCFTYAAPLIAAIDSMKSDAHVTVYFNSSAQCLNIYVVNGSHLTPKQ
jgi:hypothetical protein